MSWCEWSAVRKTPTPARWRMCAWCRFARQFVAWPRGLLAVHSDADEIVAHLFHVAHLVFDFVVDRIWPFVIDPPGARSPRDPDHSADQVLSVLISQVEQVFADYRWPRP